MSQSFYRAFEDRYRGSRQLIKNRQQIYLPFIQPLKTLYPECSILDLGCGRGEWLEILLENGFRAQGIDLDEGMLENCKALSLPAAQGEALATLAHTADESLSVVSGFHIAEHIPFSDLQHLVTEALRVLKPAGLLILETPNPENLVVGASDFYVDPTHVRPVPHPLLSFLTEHAGFKRSKLLRLQESSQLANSERLSLMNVLSGASPDYAVVAQKNAPDSQLALFDQMFEKEYGLALEALARRYEEALQKYLAELAKQLHSGAEQELVFSQQLKQLLAQTDQLNQRADNTERLVNLASKQLQAQLQEIDLQIRQAEARLQSAHEVSLKAIFASSSWRITWPLRASKRSLIWLLQSPKLHLKVLLRRAAVATANSLLKRPNLHRRVAEKLKSYPRLFAHLRQFALHHRIIHMHGTSVNIHQPNPIDLSSFADTDLNLLSPHARKIYSDLKRALVEKKEF